MRVGINGMGRIGRLELRSAMGGLFRPDTDPRAANRLEVIHLNEIKGTGTYLSRSGMIGRVVSR